jgi:hypothetical protein
MSDDAIQTELRTLADVRQGHPFRGAITEILGGSVSVIQMKDVSPSGLKSRDELIRTEIRGRREPDWLRDGDLLLTARGASNYACVVTGLLGHTVCTPHLYVLRLKQHGQVLPEFLAWQLNQGPVQRYLAQAAEGSAQLSIRKPVLESVPLKVPPLPKQQAIVALAKLAAAEQHALQSLLRNRERELAAIAEQWLG